MCQTTQMGAKVLFSITLNNMYMRSLRQGTGVDVQVSPQYTTTKEEAGKLVTTAQNIKNFGWLRGRLHLFVPHFKNLKSQTGAISKIDAAGFNVRTMLFAYPYDASSCHSRNYCCV